MSNLGDSVLELSNQWELLYKHVARQRDIMQTALQRISAKDPRSCACEDDCDCIGCTARRAIRESLHVER